MKYDFAVIGLGKVGSALLALLSQAGHRPCWAVSSKQGPGGVPLHQAIPDHPQGARVVFLAVPDSAISGTASRIAALWKDACRGVVFFHLSGLHTSELLHELEENGAEVASLHPLQSILDKDLAQAALREAFFTFEGSPRAYEAASALASALSSTLVVLAREDKVVYHTAAVIASNYLVALASEASLLMESVGLGMPHLMPLIRGTVANIDAHGARALTGPVQRGDWDTVREHIESLKRGFPDILPSYLALGKFTARLACREWPGEFDDQDKLLGKDALGERVAALKSRGMKVVFTNGCFDILHEGHVSYLREARALGDALVVGVNSDASVSRLSGLPVSFRRGHPVRAHFPPPPRCPRQGRRLGAGENRRRRRGEVVRRRGPVASVPARPLHHGPHRKDQEALSLPPGKAPGMPPAGAQGLFRIPGLR